MLTGYLRQRRRTLLAFFLFGGIFAAAFALYQLPLRAVAYPFVLCAAAGAACRRLGYEPVLLTDQLCCQAKEAGSVLAAIARTHQDTQKSLAFLAGGETVVLLTGQGKGGRNQELALAAAQGIAGLENTLIFSLGSDGTDGPTDAAGGLVDGSTKDRLEAAGLTIHQVLAENDAYHALDQVDGLIRTGPTGTNVNDVAVVLIKR